MRERFSPLCDVANQTDDDLICAPQNEEEREPKDDDSVGAAALLTHVLRFFLPWKPS